MKHFRLLLPLLILALLLSGCGGVSDEPYTYTANGRTLNVYPESGTIVDGLNVYRYTRSENNNGTIDYVITYPDGGRYYWTATKNGGQGGGTGVNENLYLSGNILTLALEAGEPEPKVGSVLGGLLLMALGALNFFAPEFTFHINWGWKLRNAEPSAGYLTMVRVGGAAIAVCGLILLLI